KADLNVKFVMGVGGTFDVYSGALTRAPNWVQKLGMEWLFRLCQEPKRMWRRYLTSNSIFAKLLVLEKVKLLNFFRWIK
ncbi:MAG: WecB/TagA/CpsF family glycosyltransferase, partial [Colwellia sp.]